MKNLLATLKSLAVVFTMALPAPASAETMPTFKRIPTQYIAALGRPGATAGKGAEHWGLWRKDPGPRGVWLKRFDKLKQADGIAPARWTFDPQDWWLDENGLIMEKPEFSLPPGKYVVTGDRETMTVLTVDPMDSNGTMHWRLDFDARLYDVTHLPCRSARYQPASEDAQCTPQGASQSDFPIAPGHPMPRVPGCTKQDYAVLFVIAMATNEEASTADMAACSTYGSQRPGMRMLEAANDTLVLCPDAGKPAAIATSPLQVKSADLRNLDDPSQRPRCKAKARIEAQCATRGLCIFEINDNLCDEPDIARHTTHAEIVWKCRSDTGWHFNRFERGQDVVIDCRE
jgi:hypothetical protein